ncbi:unnamed protein product [Peniophora sp. CBMAI 1063]|nr:unnamed protein product [Peniophora sp. CBMAI 1063]
MRGNVSHLSTSALSELPPSSHGTSRDDNEQDESSRHTPTTNPYPLQSRNVITPPMRTRTPSGVLARLQRVIRPVSKLAAASSRASEMRQAYELSGVLDVLDQAIDALQNGLESAPVSRASVNMRRDLYSCLYRRFEHTGCLDDLDVTVAATRRIEKIVSANSITYYSDKRCVLLDLSRFLRLRFRLAQKQEDIDDAIDVLRQMGGYELNPPFAADLGTCFRYRFESLGQEKDLQEALTFSGRAVRIVHDNERNKPRCIHELSLCLRLSFDRYGGLGELDEAIVRSWDAVNHPLARLKSTDDFLHNLSYLLYLRYERLGKLEDLDSTIDVCKRRIALMPNSSIVKIEGLSQLDVYLRRRFQRLGKLDDLEGAIAAVRDVDRLRRDADQLLGRDIITVETEDLHDLFDSRVERLSLTSDELDGAVTILQSSIEEFCGIYTLDASEQFSSLGLFLFHRFERMGDYMDLDDSIAALRNALLLTLSPPQSFPFHATVAHPCDAEQLITLGRSLLKRFEHIGEIADLKSAVRYTKLGIEAMPKDHPRLLRAGLVTLGRSLHHHFDHYKELDDIEEAIRARRRVAVELTSKAHIDRPCVLNDLFLSLRSRFMEFRTRQNYDETCESLMSVMTEPLGDPSLRLHVAMRYANFLSESHPFSSAESLLNAHELIISILPEIAWLGHSPQRRFAEIARLGELVNTAVAAAIRAGSLRQAIEWLEAGRTLIWAQILSLRMPLDDIGDHHPDLARSLFDIHSELQGSAYTGAERHREIVHQYDILMGQIRHCIGCKNFLRPRTLANLISSPAFIHFNGTLVLINVAESGCDALVLSSTGNVKLVPLPLTLRRARNMNEIWTRHVDLCGSRSRGMSTGGPTAMRSDSAIFARVLNRLWLWVVHPILKTLGFLRASRNDRLPHIIWCPTGPLTQLPLHAAGLYDEEAGHRVFDYIVSSYTPSLSALLKCCDGVVKENPAPNVLVVTQPDTPGSTPLPGTQLESALLRALLPERKQTLLEHKQATVGATLAVIDHHPWVHLACHGSQNLEDPTQSAFALYDGPLTLSTLMATVAGNAELAFLSACQTAAGDSKIPEESAHLAAGMLAVGFKGVVATMWSIRDEDAPVVVEEYYKKLLECRSTESLGQGETGAAYALHEATRRLREWVGETAFERWVPFVHYGV